MNRGKFVLKTKPSNKKAFFPAYGLSLFLLLIISLQVFGTFVAPKTSGNVLAYATNVSVSGLQSSQNSQRSSNGVSALTLNSKLSTAAQNKANDMATRNYWSHNTPEGNEPWIFITNAGYSYLKAGENLAYGFDSSAAVVQGWMNSPSHKANVLDSGFSEVGFGIANSPDYQNRGQQTIVVAMYAQPVSAPTPAPLSTPPPAATPKPTAPVTPTPAPVTPEPIVEVPAEESPISNEPTAEETTGFTTDSSSTPPSEVKSSVFVRVLQGNAPRLMYATSVLSLVAGMWFVTQHSVRLKRTFTEGEEYVLAHPAIEVSLLTGLMLVMYLSTSGFVR